MYSRGYGSSSGVGIGALSAVLLIALLFIGCCGYGNWLVYDAVIGYECSGEGMEYTCVPEDLEMPEQDAASDEVAPSDPALDGVGYGQ